MKTSEKAKVKLLSREWKQEQKRDPNGKITT